MNTVYPKASVKELIGNDASIISNYCFMLNWDIGYAERELDSILTRYGY